METMTVKRAAVYCRASTASQRIDAQQHAVLDFVRQRGWSYRIYADRAQSGAKEKRPALDRLLEDVRCQKVQAVVVWSLDRLARNLRHCLALLEEFHANGVGLVCCKQNLDFTSAAGKLMYAVIGAVAAFEKDLLGERIRMGLKEARRNGKHIGRPQRVRLSSTEVRKMKAAHQAGSSLRSIARQYGTTTMTAKKLMAASGD